MLCDIQKESDLFALDTSKSVIKTPLEQWCDQEIKEMMLQMFPYTNYPASSSQFILWSTMKYFFKYKEIFFFFKYIL